MNYYAAREVQCDGRGTGIWHWTCLNDGVVWPSEPCTSACQHRSAEEAERHRYDYHCASLQEQAWDDWTGCKVHGCDTPTKKTLGPRDAIGGTPLCDLHLTPTQWMAMHPFTRGMTRIAS